MYMLVEKDQHLYVPYVSVSVSLNTLSSYFHFQIL